MMKFRLILLMLLCLHGPPAHSQANSGTANTKGSCSPAVSGSKNTFVIHCGIGEQQGRRIVALLNAILENRNLDAANAKLDELLKLVSQPTQIMNCANGNCIQGNNYGSQNINQYGAPKLTITDAQLQEITEAMRPYAGKAVTIIFNQATDDSLEYGNRLADALTSAGLAVNRISSSIMAYSIIKDGKWIPAAIPPGVEITYGKNRSEIANALALVMLKLGLLMT